MSTPFDEFSVSKCADFDLDVIKIASSDIKDWFLIEAIAELKKPVIASSGGSSLKDLDDLVNFFARRNIPFALNHCVSLYPSEDSALELNQIENKVASATVYDDSDGDREGEGKASNMLGSAYASQGSYEQAIGLMRTGLERAQERAEERGVEERGERTEERECIGIHDGDSGRQQHAREVILAASITLCMVCWR